MMPFGIACGKSVPSRGHWMPGQARFMRISTMKAPPHNAMNMESTRYWMPMTLWSRLKR